MALMLWLEKYRFVGPKVSEDCLVGVCGELGNFRAVHNCMHMYKQVLVYVYISPTCVSSVLRCNEDPCSGMGRRGTKTRRELTACDVAFSSGARNQAELVTCDATFSLQEEPSS
jgi:hypothetical protein